MNAFIKTLFLSVHKKFDNLVKTDNFYPAFLHKEAIYLSKIKILSKVSVSYFPNFFFPKICPNIVILKSQNKWHYSWFNFVELFSNHSIAR